LNFGQIGYTVGDTALTAATAGDDDYENLNGVFVLDASGTDLEITATSYGTDGTTVMNTVVLTVAGTTPGDITTEINQ